MAGTSLKTTNNVNNVTVGKPQITGGIYMAPSGTTLPTDASTALSDDYKSLGYVSEDGVKVSTDRSSETIKAWGGDTVATPTTGVTYSMQFTLIEYTSENVLQLVYGKEHVNVGTDGKFDAYATAEDLEEHVFVIETMDRKGDPLRMIIPNGKLTSNGETSLTDSEVAGYDVTITALPHSEDDYDGASYLVTNK
jgi:hypothetical protein